MATTYQAPGVYIEELDKGIKPIEIVGSSTAAFIGISELASIRDQNDNVVESRINKATLITNWRQYTQVFGGFSSNAYMPDAVYAYFSNGGGPCYVTSLRALQESSPEQIAASVEVPSEKGESFSVVANIVGDIANGKTVVVADGKEKGTFDLTIDGETIEGLNMKKTDAKYVGKAKFSIASIEDAGSTTTPPIAGTYTLAGGGVVVEPISIRAMVGDIEARTGLAGLEEFDDVRLITAPDIWIGYDGSDKQKERIKGIQTEMIKHCEKIGYCFALLDTPKGLTAQGAKEWREYVNFDTSYAAMYYPWVKVADLSDNDEQSKMVPPSGAMVGIYNRTDSERGVHKAPANEVLRGVIDVERRITKGEQVVLNPMGVNCIREFKGRGIRIWGARTLSSDGSWRYINVRRLFILIEASMDVGLQWVVFEPNDQDLWARVRRDVTGFLRMIWRTGALFGTSEGEAFYVKCDEELNPIEVRDAGQLIIEVGVCPVKPAEFVIFRISQWAGPNAE